MNIQIIIPAHNEEAFLTQTLDSLVAQTLRPSKVIVVNDGSTDGTQAIIHQFSAKHPFITSVTSNLKSEHEPGSKIINAFYKGFEMLDKNFDVICKFDADLIFPQHYLEKISEIFQSNSKIGMVGGFCTIEANGIWKVENLTNKDHIRGALKAYRKECFEQIGGLKNAMGWDTVDELLAKFHGWEVSTTETLHVKHLKPTGATYTKTAKYKQGEAFYKMRYGYVLTQIATIKLATKKESLNFYYNCMRGYLKAKKSKASFLVTEEEGRFIRELRWKNIKKKVF
ncbi:glycosyltransferase family 2 protein [Rasiella sp. SM2506]|uniref:glycosyltransferase family 2 protein n=1 Tax=Rasiella sp. SM2506 TaxID=3423914 RepID=UPI003D7A2CFF